MDNNKLIALAHLYMQGKATEEEQRQLHEWYDGINNDGDEEEVIVTDKTESENETGQRILSNLRKKIRFKEAPVVPIYKHKWRRAAAAAAVLLMISVGSYFIFKNKDNKDIAKTEPQEKRFKNDIAAPANVKATITLADGRIVALDSVVSGTLATQGNVKLIKTADGKIIYNALQQAQGNMQYNTLTNPRGSKVIDMTLADGSRVWLNAGSSVTYPVSFVGNERKVSITGEAYFEVAHNTMMPFVVQKNDISVKVLGTHFNVNAYDDETNVKVTLLEGSVKILHSAQDDKGVIIKPGEQAQVALPSFGSAQDRLAQGNIKVVKGVDTNEVMAWKNGRFYFDGTDIKTMMKQLSRWYNVEVEFKADIKSSFVAKISRDEPVTELLKILELTNLVHFKIEGNKIEVIK